MRAKWEKIGHQKAKEKEAPAKPATTSTSTATPGPVVAQPGSAPSTTSVPMSSPAANATHPIATEVRDHRHPNGVTPPAAGGVTVTHGGIPAAPPVVSSTTTAAANPHPAASPAAATATQPATPPRSGTVSVDTARSETLGKSLERIGQAGNLAFNGVLVATYGTTAAAAYGLAKGGLVGAYKGVAGVGGALKSVAASIFKSNPLGF
jgi:hypothetical protein